MAPAEKPRTDLPTIEADSRPFWDAMRDEGVFLVIECNACGHIHHYPRPFCPSCWSDDISWKPASGNATLYTYSTVFMNDLKPFSDNLPYIAAVVELEEGPKVMTTIVGTTPEDLVIGMPLRMVPTVLTEEITIPNFTPATA